MTIDVQKATQKEIEEWFSSKEVVEELSKIGEPLIEEELKEIENIKLDELMA